MIRDRTTAAAGSALLLAAVIAPVAQNWRRRPGDSFPLSYYPMFSARRAATLTVTHLMGVDAAGDRHVLPVALVGAGGMNQLRKQVRRRAKRGEGEDLARAVAERIAARRRHRDVVAVQVVTARHRLADFFGAPGGSGAHAPEHEVVHATVTVVREVRDRSTS